MRLAAVAVAALVGLPVLATTSYEDDTLRHRDPHPRQVVDDSTDSDDDAITSTLGLITTRCNPTNSSQIQRYEHGKWMNHYTCPTEVPCVEIRGHGACLQDPDIWIVPGTSMDMHLRCTDPHKPATCNVLASSPAELRGHSSVKRQDMRYPTRCDPQSFGEVQYFNGTAWQDFYRCASRGACLDITGKAACHDGDHFSFPEAWGPPIGIFAPPPPSPSPHPTTPVLPAPVYPPVDVVFDSPSPKPVSEDLPQNIVAQLLSSVLSDLGLLPPRPTPNAVNSIPTIHQDPITTVGAVPTPNKIVPGASLTRCDPSGSLQIEALVDGSWVGIYQCQHKCVGFVGTAACEDQRDKYLIPQPVPVFRQPLKTRMPEPPAVGISSRCNPDTPEQFQVYQDGQFLLYGECPGKDQCKEIDGWAECDVDGQQWFPERPVSLQSRQRRPKPPPPDFHTIDTRCNPEDANEVQRFTGTGWEHHYTCTFRGACLDVDGHGACRLKANLHEVPAANETSIGAGYPSNPLRIKTKCNTYNETEVLAWNGTDWAFNGVCLSPYSCYDFSGSADFAFCASPQLGKDQIWLPWPSLTAVSNQRGVVTRCQKGNILEQFDGQTWVPLRKCSAGFQCSNIDQLPYNGGCVASSIEAVKRHLLQHEGAPAEYGQHYEPFGFDHAMAKRDDSGLIEDGAGMVTQGQTLVQGGKDLVDDSATLHRLIFGDAQEDEQPSRPHITREDDGLIEESEQMHAQGLSLIREGERMKHQGRKLLNAIYGDGVPDLFESVPSKDASRTKFTYSIIPRHTDAVYGDRIPDGVETMTSKAATKIDPFTYSIIPRQSDASEQARDGALKCETECACKLTDDTCREGCAECMQGTLDDVFDELHDRDESEDDEDAMDIRDSPKVCGYRCTCRLTDAVCAEDCARCQAGH